MDRGATGKVTKDETITTLRQMKGFFRNKRIGEAMDIAIDALLDREYGEWLKMPDTEDGLLVFRCSQCDEEYVLLNGTPKENGYNFCPACGSEMEDNSVTHEHEQNENIMTVGEKENAQEC